MILRYPVRTGSTKKLCEVVTTCVIMHDMVVKDEHEDQIFDQVFQFQGENVVSEYGPATFAQ